MNAIAIDDEPLALEVIKAHSEKISYLDLKATFLNALEALVYLQANAVDLVFLDIKMPDISGLELYKSLHRKPLVVFTTAYAEHAISGFDLDAIDYLLKPFSLSRFLKACNKALEIHQFRSDTNKPQTYCLIRSGNDLLKVVFQDILFIEASGNYVTFVLTDKKILTRSTFSEVQQWLPEEEFTRIHRSYLVNYSKIEKADKANVFIGNHNLPLSEAYSKKFFELWK